VSDLDVWQTLCARGNSQLLLIRDLHAKYFRFDAEVIVSSCNITGAALGFKQPSNLEIAISVEANAQTAAFEAYVASLAVPVTQEMYDALRRILESLPPIPMSAIAGDASPPDILPLPGSRSASPNWSHWLPTCRTPEALFDAYCGRLADLTHATRNAALADLLHIEPPVGLSRDQFESFVAGTVHSSPLIAKLAAFAITPRRFGEMRELLRKFNRPDSVLADWQTVMRWLLHFAPDRFSMRVATYSEIFEAKW